MSNVVSNDDLDAPTRFVETNVLLAVHSGDDDHARDLLCTMLPNELGQFSGAAQRTVDLAYAERRHQFRTAP